VLLLLLLLVAMHNLEMLQVMGRAFCCPVGLFDYHAGEEMLYAVVALGANVIERACVQTTFLKNGTWLNALAVGELAVVVRKCGNVYKAKRSAL
jgi:sialic acid synthase SpsE